jgi:hypothetical protein
MAPHFRDKALSVQGPAPVGEGPQAHPESLLLIRTSGCTQALDGAALTDDFTCSSFGGLESPLQVFDGNAATVQGQKLEAAIRITLSDSASAGSFFSLAFSGEASIGP